MGHSDSVEHIRRQIMDDPQNAQYTARGVPPLFAAPPTARINIVGQAPGRRAEATRLYWNDVSGDRLRAWLGVDRGTFYESGLFAVLPMDFYFPGKGRSGDLPPRPGFADKWHRRILDELPDMQLTVLVGAYAQRFYLGVPPRQTLTETVEHYEDFLPGYFPTVHPSPRNKLWLRRNPWFEQQAVPDLRERVERILA
ncbi:uracil-DNA glycosylase family protein [Bifidobacterium cuniculi]|uniref:Uracil DNA glycosylase n=1 Tax=Bifidobacterium cuniculi TaxID=1688 RepID=A0A087B2N6_9BIFI|nr:uracil-DNA glycosylase family protein [Bifidobacterium cuniculi]KFI65286.1 uracil DNA glycosylase [Bifidobacterium cuniculi]